MRRLWVRWALLIAFVAALGTAFVNLGEWQLDRLHQRRERNLSTVHNEEQAVRPWNEVFTRTITDAEHAHIVGNAAAYEELAAGHRLASRV